MKYFLGGAWAYIRKALNTPLLQLRLAERRENERVTASTRGSIVGSCLFFDRSHDISMGNRKDF